MRVAIDAQVLPGQGGVGEYTLGLVGELLRQPEHEYILFTTELTRRRLGDRLRNAYAVIPSNHSPVSPAWLVHSLPRWLTRLKARVHHGPAFLLPRKKVCPYIATVHDMIYRLFPGTMTWRRRLFWRLFMPNTWRRADSIFADSDSTRQDILRLTRFPAERITVLPAAVAGMFNPKAAAGEMGALRARYGVGENYFLFVGTLEPRKNLGLVLAAFRRYRERGGRRDLVIAGPPGWKETGIFQTVRQADFAGHVHLTGWIDPPDLPALYRQALGFLFPSRYEGFGIPVLEAMSCGTPVIATRVSSLPEVGQDAALYLESEDAGELAGLMQRLEEDSGLREQCRQLGVRRAKKFSWQRTAQQAAAAYAALGGG